MPDLAVAVQIPSGKTVYFVDLNNTGLAWNVGTSTFTTFSTTQTNFANPATETDATGTYTGAIPGPAGYRQRIWYIQIGGSPASTDTAVLQDEGYWDGTHWQQLNVQATATPPVGPGSTPYIPTILSGADFSPVSDCKVWISQDSAGVTVIAGTLITKSDGTTVPFMLDSGVTYYLWAQKDGFNAIQGAQFAVP